MCGDYTLIQLGIDTNYHSMTNVKNDLNEELSTLIREYEARGLSADEISDSLSWHADLAESRNDSAIIR